jgi:hypothetical protein
MITIDQAILTLRLLLPSSKKVFYTVNGDLLANNQVVWLFRFFVPKENELVLVTPLISQILGDKTTDTEFLRIRAERELEKTLVTLQNGISKALPNDGIIFADISAAHGIVELALLGDTGVRVPDVLEFEIPKEEEDV